MGELSDDEIASLSDMDINTYEPASMATVIKLAREVKRHRAARSASAERVRSVVREEAWHVTEAYFGTKEYLSMQQLTSDIADRVASQLAVPESHRVQVARLADSLGTDLGADAVAATALRARADSRKLAFPFPVLSAEEREAADWLLGRMTDSMLGTAGGHGMHDFQMLEDARALIRRLLGAKP